MKGNFLVVFRYQILAPTAVSGGFVDGKKACEMLLDAMQLEKASYRVGSSKVFYTTTIEGLQSKHQELQVLGFTCTLINISWHSEGSGLDRAEWYEYCMKAKVVKGYQDTIFPGSASA